MFFVVFHENREFLMCFSNVIISFNVLSHQFEKVLVGCLPLVYFSLSLNFSGSFYLTLRNEEKAAEIRCFFVHPKNRN